MVEDWQTKNQELQVSFDNLGSKFDELQSKLSLSEDKCKLSLEEQADLSDKLCIKESEISSLIDKLDTEKDKSQRLERELIKINKNLCNTQKLLRQYHTKKVNWTNYYVDLEADYYNGLNYHLDQIYWLEEECEKLKKIKNAFQEKSLQKRSN